MLRVNDAVKINTDAHLHPGGRLCFVKHALLRATIAIKLVYAFVAFVAYFFMFRLFRASWYLLALTRFIFATRAATLSALLRATIAIKLVYTFVALLLCCFCGLFLYVSLVQGFLVSLGIDSLYFCDPRGNTFCVASRDHRYKARLCLCCFCGLFLYVSLVQGFLVSLDIDSLCFLRPARQHFLRCFARPSL